MTAISRTSTYNARPEGGFSLPELVLAMAITVTLMSIVFAVMRQNQNIFATETGVTSMNENVRAAVDLLTREVQAAGTGLRGMTAPILGVDSRGEAGDQIAILFGDLYAPIADVRAGVVGANGQTSIGVRVPVGAVSEPGALRYRDEKGKMRDLYRANDRYVLYNKDHFTIVRVASWAPTVGGDLIVSFAVDESNPRAKFGDYRYEHARDSNGASFARLDAIVYYRYDRESERLERREDHDPWADVARGILGFQVRYRVLGDDGTLSEPVDEPPEDREGIRSVVATIRAHTPDVEPTSQYYRETTERVEMTPRNMRVSLGRPGDTQPPP